jgi:lauroyl/myristoyl acyltransferase
VNRDEHSNGAASAWAPSGLRWRRLAYAGARFGPEPWLRLSPPFFGVAFALALPEKRATVRRNLRTVLGPRSRFEEELDVYRTFMSYARCVAEALASERRAIRQARRRFRDGSKLRALFEARRGLVVATAHAGAWDVAAPLLAQDLRVPVMIAMRAEEDAGARALHDSVRATGGVRVAHVGGHPLDALPLLHHLRDGGVVAMQLDRVGAGSRVVEVELFGHSFSAPEGPFVLAALARVPVLPLFVRRRGYLDYEFVAGDPIELPGRPKPDDVKAAAQRAAREMERFIRANPTQWFHFG